MKIPAIAVGAVAGAAVGSLAAWWGLPPYGSALASAVVAAAVAGGWPGERVGEDMQLASLRKQSDLKTHALSNLSHELRTPLTSVRGYCEMLKDEMHGPLNARQKEIVQTVLTGTATLLQLVNNLLDLSKLEAGKMELTRRRVVLAECLEGALDVIEPLAAQKGLSLDVRLPDHTVAVVGSFDRLRQVLVNLLGNAVKFTERGGIHVTLREDDGQAVLEVADSGIGIAPEHLQTVFDEFTQADPTIRRRFGGSGLGLAIAKRIVEWHDGRISVTSVPNEGTTFVVRLPALVARPGDGRGQDRRRVGA